MLCSYRATEFAAYLQVAVLSIVLRSSDCDPVTLKELNASAPLGLNGWLTRQPRVSRVTAVTPLHAWLFRGNPFGVPSTGRRNTLASL
jgi:hypothetical protein